MSDYKSVHSHGTHDSNVHKCLPSQPTLLPPQQESSLSSQPTSDIESKLKEVDAILSKIEAILSKIVALQEVKLQIRRWGCRLLHYEKVKALGRNPGPRAAFHMVFLGNPGTGKTMVAHTFGKILHLLGLISEDKVTEVQRADVVDKSIKKTRLKTRKKIQEASGGILLVDDAYRLMPLDFPSDFGIEVLEEIMAAMDKENIVVIFVGPNVEMNDIISGNPNFAGVGKKLYFNDYTPTDMANILHLKMNTEERHSFTYGYRLDSDCTVEAIAKLIEEHTTEEQRKMLNGGIVDLLLVNALKHLNFRLDINCTDTTILVTVTMEDLEAGLKSLKTQAACHKRKREHSY